MRFGRHPLRLRLTLLYCLVSVVSSAVLLFIMYALARSLSPGLVRPLTGPSAPLLPYRGLPGAGDGGIALRVRLSTEMLVLPGIALAIMAVFSLLLGWLIAGRVLRPVLTMTERLHRISERNVHERLSLPGRRNELKDLADTVDGLLGRLETTLETNKRFVANAAHELRTPLTVERALLEEPLIDPAASLESFRANFERLLAITDQRGRLLESLLTLSGSEDAHSRDEPVDLTGLIEKTLQDRAPDVKRRGLRVRSTLRPVRIPGDQVLLARLLANLYDNAIHYNVPGGTVEIGVRHETGRIVLSVANTGQVIPPDQVDRLFEPFQRLRRIADDGHHGLGLSIVRAIARAHRADLTAVARPGGGLAVDIAFPTITPDR
ncbi:ATP-binding protein [Streptosporangium sp. NPDC049644]|uniref:sensor histidine kinase n=1 Tax=Streptosporangium sp. NPDC049644 TaxID=3155507 RepID=UPI0034181D8C